MQGSEPKTETGGSRNNYESHFSREDLNSSTPRSTSDKEDGFKQFKRMGMDKIEEMERKLQEE